VWNDTRIKNNNPPSVADKLPFAPIILGYHEDNNVSVAEVVKQALQSFSPDFKTSLYAAQYLWANMTPALQGRSFENGVFDDTKVAFLQVRTTFLARVALCAVHRADPHQQFNRHNPTA
jgi:hypothetical protein